MDEEMTLQELIELVKANPHDYSYCESIEIPRRFFAKREGTLSNSLDAWIAARVGPEIPVGVIVKPVYEEAETVPIGGGATMRGLDRLMRWDVTLLEEEP